MPLFGVHESIVGGFEQAVFDAVADGFDTVQIFSKNSGHWQAKPIEPEAAENFKNSIQTTGLVRPLIHDSYLINLASPKSDLLEKSLDAFAEELSRAETLGIEQVVMHPGSATDGDEKGGLARIASSLGDILDGSPPTVRVLLETTAGQGSNLGWKFEHLAEIIAGCRFPQRLGVCMDTCHVFAAGNDFTTRAGYDDMMARFDRTVGLDRLEAFHLNDSMRECGSRVDRHEAIGFGKIGREPFGLFVTDPRFDQYPMYLETPKGTMEIDGRQESWDIINLRTLRQLCEKK